MTWQTQNFYKIVIALFEIDLKLVANSDHNCKYIAKILLKITYEILLNLLFIFFGITLN